MKQPPNPIAQGFRRTSRDPATFLLEILWRWSFGIIVFLALFGAGAALLGSLHLSDLFLTAWKNQDPRGLGIIGLSILIQPGAKLLSDLAFLVALSLALGLLWSLLAAAVRRIVVRRLSSIEPLGFGSMLAVQWLRALVALLAVFLLLAGVGFAIYMATREGRTDLSRFYLIFTPSALLIIAIWLVLNWRLSMAAIFGLEGQNFRAALGQARHMVGRHRSDFAGTAFVFLLLRTFALLSAAAVIGLTSSMLGTAPQTYAALVMSVALVYFVVSDYFYVARLASYLALGAAPDPIAAEMGIVDPELPVEKSTRI